MANLAVQSNDIVTWTNKLSMDDVLREKGNFERNISQEGEIHI